MDRIAVLLEVDEQSSIAAMGFGVSSRFEDALMDAIRTGEIQWCIGQMLNYFALRCTIEQYQESGLNPNTPYIESALSAENLLARLTKNGITKYVDTTIKTITEDDLFSPDRFRNFENLDAVFILERQGETYAAHKVGNKSLSAISVLQDYRNGDLYSAMPQLLAANG